MEYRIATKNDIIELLCLYKQLFPNENLDISIAESIWDKTVANNTTTYFIAVNDKLGFVLIHNFSSFIYFFVLLC